MSILCSPQDLFWERMFMSMNPLTHWALQVLSTIKKLCVVSFLQSIRTPFWTFIDEIDGLLIWFNVNDTKVTLIAGPYSISAFVVWPVVDFFCSAMCLFNSWVSQRSFICDFADVSNIRATEIALLLYHAKEVLPRQFRILSFFRAVFRLSKLQSHSLLECTIMGSCQCHCHLPQTERRLVIVLPESIIRNLWVVKLSFLLS